MREHKYKKETIVIFEDIDFHKHKIGIIKYLERYGSTIYYSIETPCGFLVAENQEDIKKLSFGCHYFIVRKANFKERLQYKYKQFRINYFGKY